MFYSLDDKQFKQIAELQSLAEKHNDNVSIATDCYTSSEIFYDNKSCAFDLNRYKMVESNIIDILTKCDLIKFAEKTSCEFVIKLKNSIGSRIGEYSYKVVLIKLILTEEAFTLCDEIFDKWFVEHVDEDNRTVFLRKNLVFRRGFGKDSAEKNIDYIFNPTDHLIKKFDKSVRKYYEKEKKDESNND